MKIKLTLIAICCLFLGMQEMNAQRGMKYHLNVEQISQDLELTETQVADMNKLKADIEKKKEEMKSDGNFDRKKMQEYKEQWKLEMNAILTVEQQEKLASIKEERMQEMRQQKEAFIKEKIEKRKEIAAYKEKVVNPVMQEKRLELEKKISKDDKVKVDILRKIAKEEKKKTREKMEDDFMRGVQGKSGHHKMGGHKKAKHGKASHAKKWMKENPESYEMAQELVAKYSEDILSIQEDMVEERALWKAEMDAINSKGEPKSCDPKNCDPKNCDPKDCDPKNCDPSQCDPSDCKPGKSAKRKGHHGKRGKHGKKGQHLTEEERSFAKQLHFLLMDVPATEVRSLNQTKFPELVAHPNPANINQSLTLSLFENQKVEITVIDITGKEMMEVHKGRLDEGEHNIDVDLSSLGSNIYFYRVTTKAGSKLVKFMVARS